MKRIKTFLQDLVAAVSDSLYHATFGYMQRLGMLLTMAAHTAVETYTDTVYAISASLPATYDAAGYAATTITYTTIGGVMKFPGFGSERGVNVFKPISGAAEYTKGSPEYGQGDLVCKDVPADAGQVICKAAEASANHYSIKATYPDGEVKYFDVLVASWKESEAAEGQPVLRTAKLTCCKAPVVVAAS